MALSVKWLPLLSPWLSIWGVFSPWVFPTLFCQTGGVNSRQNGSTAALKARPGSFGTTLSNPLPAAVKPTSPTLPRRVDVKMKWRQPFPSGGGGKQPSTLRLYPATDDGTEALFRHWPGHCSPAPSKPSLRVPPRHTFLNRLTRKTAGRTQAQFQPRFFPPREMGGGGEQFLVTDSLRETLFSRKLLFHDLC